MKRHFLTKAEIMLDVSSLRNLLFRKRETALRVFVLGLLDLYFRICAAQQPLLSADKRTQIEAAVAKFMSSTHVPGVSVAVVENGQYEWASGFGFADLENNVPASEHTLFRLASISKLLTATGAMQLWERGRLDLDAPVQKYCPAFPRKDATITTREVLGHLAGIRHYKSDSQDDPEVGNTKHFDNPIQAGLIFSKNDRIGVTARHSLSTIPLRDTRWSVA